MIFDGKGFAREIESKLREQVAKLPSKPKIVSVLVGDDPASALYTKLKKAAAERVGIDFEVVSIDSDKFNVESFSSEITRIASRDDVTGVMMQLPLPEALRGRTPKYLEGIPLNKDVDGLRWRESGVMPATVKAVLAILEELTRSRSSDHSSASLPAGGQGSELWGKKFVLLGARGAVGAPLVHFLRERGVKVSEIEWDTPDPARIILAGEVIISCVGKAGLVQEDMISNSAIVIDVGMSEVNGKVVGDMTQEVYQKAAIAVGVPGGVGPVTIASLLSNAVEIYGLFSRKP